MRRLLIIALGFMLVGAARAEDGEVRSAAANAIPREVSRAHWMHVERVKCFDALADYPPQYDSWHRIDLDRDGQHEYVVVLTIEGFGGGNNWSRFLIVYRYISPVWIAQTSHWVGGRGTIMPSGDVLLLRGDTLIVDPGRGELVFDVGVGADLTQRPQDLTDEQELYAVLNLFASGCG